MIGIILVVFVALLFGNAVLSSSGDALYHTYAELVAGDLSMSASAESNFTVFGSDRLLVGEYLVPPVIPDFSIVRERVESLPRVRGWVGLVSTTAQVTVGQKKANQVLFGVDFIAYSSLFSGLVLTAGAFPVPGEPGIVIQEGWAGAEDVATLIGKRALLASGRGRTFTLREVPVTGVFSYPVQDELLSMVALVDADTARALNGYVYGALETVELSNREQTVLDSEMDALFDVPTTGDGTEGTIDLGALLGDPGTDTMESTIDEASRSVTGAWNFLLVSLFDSGDRRGVIRTLQRKGITTDNGYRVREWWHTVGGNASLVRYLQLLMNGGLLFVALGAGIIAANALMLSVLERTGEIGTLRALGAQGTRITIMIVLETLIIVTGSALIGITVGAVGVGLLNNAGYVMENRYIAILFGGEPITGTVTMYLVLRHVGAAFLLTVGTVLYPIKRALHISPREAMAA